MMIHLYVASAAGGKTTFAVARARQAARGLGGAVMVCVANQLQRRAWRQRLAEAGGAMGVQVLTFGQLYRALLSATGETSVLLDDALQHRLLLSILDGLTLDHYKSLRAKPGFAVLLHELIAELKAANIRPHDFATAVAKMGDEPRLRELARIYEAYQDRLQANHWTDEEELGWLALQRMQDWAALASDWALLVLDGFDDLTTVQLGLLRLASRRAGETLITLSGSIAGPGRGFVHRRFEATRRKLEEALEVTGEPLPEERGAESHVGERAETLAHLERSLFVSGATALRPSERVDEAGRPIRESALQMVAAADRAGEVRAALRWLKARLVRDGCRPGEVALLARKVAPYRQLIEQTAREYGVPVRLLDGLPLAGNPAVATLLDLLHMFLPISDQDTQPTLSRRLVTESWRSPYLDWGRATAGAGVVRPIGESALQMVAAIDYGAWADRLDAVARWGRVVGGLAQWCEAFSLLVGREARTREDEEEGWPANLPSEEEVRALQDLFERFVVRTQPRATADSMADYVAWLEALIGPDGEEDEAYDGSLCVVPRAREGDGAMPAPYAEADVAALRAFKDVLRGLVWAEQALGAAPLVDYKAFYTQLRGAIEAATFRLPEDGAAEEVVVGDVVQARGAPYRAVAVLGLAEGEFPMALHESPLLRDGDRLQLGLSLSTESAEAEYFYETIARAREQLLLTRPRLAENGAVWEPSPYWEEVCRLVDVEPRVLGSETPIAPQEAASWPELLEGLAERAASSPWHAWAKAQDAARYRAWQAAGEVFEERYGSIQRGAGRSQGAPGAGKHSGDLSECAGELAQRYGPRHAWSVSRLESYRTCPQAFFVGAALGLQPREEPAEGLDASQLGNIYHRLFQEVYQACPEEGRVDREQLLAALDKVGGTILAEAPRREGFRETAWWLQTRDEIMENMRRSLQAMASMAGGYVPSHFELEFEAAPIWTSPDGQDSLLLHGTVDRVDVCSDGGLRIIDYKTAGPARFGRKALEEGKKLQLPLYALAIRQALQGEIRDGFYWHVRRAEASALSLRDYGVEESLEDGLRFALEAVQGIRAGMFQPHPPSDGCPAYCPAASFCWLYRPGYGGS